MNLVRILFHKTHLLKCSLFILAAVDICNAALGYLNTGLSTKSITNAASKIRIQQNLFFIIYFYLDHLQLDVETVRTTIDSLLWLYTECAKTKVNILDFIYLIFILII